MPDKPTNMCSVCGGADLKRCPCPWGKPFQSWPAGLLDKVKAMTAGGPHKGS